MLPGLLTHTARHFGEEFELELGALICTGECRTKEWSITLGELVRFERFVSKSVLSRRVGGGEALRFARKSLGMRREDAARLAKVPADTMGRIERSTEMNASVRATYLRLLEPR